MNAGSAARELRVFVSSTFHDMQRERDELVRRVFPPLRELCEQRGVNFVEVDLRWGIPEERSAAVLDICLAEIRECRPYFIGILGERYGWIPEAFDDATVEAEPWLADYRGRSVTELEIVEGVLKDPTMAAHAFFYLRDPAYAADRPEFQEMPMPEDIRLLGAETANELAASRRRKLEDLKNTIRHSGLPVREGYADPKAFGQKVFEDLKGVIDQVFPAGSEPDESVRESHLHQVFARRRTDVYSPPVELIARVDAQIRGTGRPLVIWGGPGSGKSALIANLSRWLVEPGGSDGEPAAPAVVTHFVGASASSMNWIALCRRLTAELNQTMKLRVEVEGDAWRAEIAAVSRFIEGDLDLERRGLSMADLGLRFDLPDERAPVLAAFREGLRQAAGRGRLVLAIDGLDQLEDRDGAPDLGWLPEELPDNVRVVLTTQPGRALDEARRRGWTTLEIPSLKRDERERIVVDWLSQFTKELPAELVRMIVDAEQSGNPRYLRILLEELRIYGEHETVQHRIRDALRAKDPAELYEQRLARWDEDLNSDRADLVRDAMVYLWAARRGLSEHELRSILGDAGEELPQVYWSPLRLAGQTVLINRDGLIGFANDEFCRAVENRYVSTDSDRRWVHEHLADYFQSQPLGHVLSVPAEEMLHTMRASRRAVRGLDELPWQLLKAHAWERLYAVLSEPEVVKALYERAPWDIRLYWGQLEANSPYRLIEGLAPVIEAPRRDDPAAWYVANILQTGSHPDKALEMYRRLGEQAQTAGDQRAQAFSVGRQGSIVRRQGKLDSALAMFQEQERILRDLNDMVGVGDAVFAQATVSKDRGDIGRAETLLNQADEIYRQAGAAAQRDEVRTARATILHLQGRIESALELLREAERRYRQQGNLRRLADVVNERGACHQRLDDVQSALECYIEAEKLFRDIGDPRGAAGTQVNLALLATRRGDLEQALHLIDSAERTFRELNAPSQVATALDCRAGIHQKRHDLPAALATYAEAEAIYRAIDDAAGLITNVNNQAITLAMTGDLSGARDRIEDAIVLARQMGGGLLARVLSTRGLVLRLIGDPGSATASYREAEQLARQIGDEQQARSAVRSLLEIAESTNELASQLAAMQQEERAAIAAGDGSRVIDALQKQAALAKQLGNREEEGEAIGRLAMLMAGDLQDLETAVKLLDLQERIWRDVGDEPRLAACLERQGNLRHQLGHLDEAETALAEEEQLRRRFGQEPELAAALARRALIRFRKSDNAAAAALAREALTLARHHEMSNIIAGAEAILAALEGDELPDGEQRTQDTREAEAEARAADAAGSANGAYTLGLHLLDRGESREAEAAFARADQRGHGVGAYYHGVSLNRRGEPELAEAAFRRADERGELRGTTALGMTLFRRGDSNDAVNVLQRAAERGDGAAASNLGVVLLLNSDIEGAWDRAEAALNLSHELGNGGGSYHLGMIRQMRGDADGAESAFWMGDQRGDAESAYCLGAAFEGHGQLEAAESAYARADQRGSGRGAAALARLLRARGDVSGSEAAQDRARHRGGDDDPSAFHVFLQGG